LVVTILCTIIALVAAYPWVRQKIIWQKAGMPFLFRLANAPATVSAADAKKLQTYTDAHIRKRTERATHTPAIILTGPLWAGKTSLACGIGTEAAFRKLTVRYVTFDKLRQMAATNVDDLGPRNILYWRWRTSELVIIDDISSGSSEDNRANLEEFESIAANLGLCDGCFSGRITVWVLGPQSANDLGAWQQAIAKICRGKLTDGIGAELEIMTIGLHGKRIPTELDSDS
jgi:hypothetical protein